MYGCYNIALYCEEAHTFWSQQSLEIREPNDARKTTLSKRISDEATRCAELIECRRILRIGLVLLAVWRFMVDKTDGRQWDVKGTHYKTRAQNQYLISRRWFLIIFPSSFSERFLESGPANNTYCRRYALRTESISINKYHRESSQTCTPTYLARRHAIECHTSQ